jgi:hypothetical protein
LGRAADGAPIFLVPETKLPIRDLGPVLVGRDLLAGSAELVRLMGSDIEFDTDGAVVTHRRTKTPT